MGTSTYRRTNTDFTARTEHRLLDPDILQEQNKIIYVKLSGIIIFLLLGKSKKECLGDVGFMIYLNLGMLPVQGLR